MSDGNHDGMALVWLKKVRASGAMAMIPPLLVSTKIVIQSRDPLEYGFTVWNECI